MIAEWHLWPSQKLNTFSNELYQKLNEKYKCNHIDITPLKLKNWINNFIFIYVWSISCTQKWDLVKKRDAFNNIILDHLGLLKER